MSKERNIPAFAKSKISVSYERILAEHTINSSRSMISVINRNYIYEKVNKPFSAAHKGTGRSFIGKTLSQVWGSSVFENRIKKNFDSCLSGKTVRYKATINTPRSGNRFYEVVFRPVKTENGKTTHVLAETFDITELRQSELKLATLRKEIGVIETNFRQHLSVARRFEAIGTLAGGIVHDFNNILTTIAGYTEMLHDEMESKSSSAEKTEKIMAAVARARSLTDKILTSGSQNDLRMDTVNLDKVIMESVGLVRTVTPEGIEIETNINDAGITLCADPVDIFRVFMNLMTNAVQAMEITGGILTVTIQLTCGKDIKEILKYWFIADNYAVITISDTGPGIGADALNRIFEPFFTTKSVGKGTGMGLSVAFNIIRGLEGEISVSGEPGKGSSFKIYLPVMEPYTVEKDLVGSRKRILLAGTTKLRSSVLSLAIQNSGYDFVNVSGSRKLRSLFSDHQMKSDLVIIAVDPVNHGLVPAQYLKMIESGQMTPSLLIVGPEYRKSKGEFVNLEHISGHLFSPVIMSDLMRKIEMMLLNK